MHTEARKKQQPVRILLWTGCPEESGVGGEVDRVSCPQGPNQIQVRTALGS